MADVVNFKDYRRGPLPIGHGTRDPERAEVFPGVSLADLWRLWAKCEREKRRDIEAAPAVRQGHG